MAPADPRAAADRLYGRIHALVDRPVALMEVCGTHTMAIGRFGLRARMPGDLRLISGPGCPVCVTPAREVDRAVAMCQLPGVRVATFGDLLRVPGSGETLQEARARGGRVHVVYSPVEALELARRNPSETVVFVGVGFETTVPAIAATLVRAAEEGIANFCVIPSFKVVPPAMAALVQAGDTRIDGFICPGHVSSIIGPEPYAFLAEELGVPCVITGFEALDVLEGVAMLLEQLRGGVARVETQYRRAVPPGGNPVARAVVERVFRPADADWRGIGTLPGTGLELAPEFASFDARARLPVDVSGAMDLPRGCACGAVMKGLILPQDCPLFGTACTPARAVGPCMVSSEGACAAWYRYGRGAST